MKEDKKKQKLTLAINKDVIEKAKSEGINISKLTEEILTAVTSDVLDYDQGNLVGMYENFFDALKPYLKKYGTSIDVGRIYEGRRNSFNVSTPIILNHNGLSYVKYPDGDIPSHLLAATMATFSTFSSLHKQTKLITPEAVDVLEQLYEPTEILENFLNGIINAAERNKEKIQQFKVALGVMKALYEGDETKN